jgi:phosphopantetheine--protein transferase-like protein
VGIDIEAISPRILKIKEKFLSTNELECIDSTHEINHLLLCWSAKESVYKAMGKEDVDFKTHLQIAPFIPLEQGIFTLTECRTSAQRSYQISYVESDDYVMTWTV